MKSKKVRKSIEVEIKVRVESTKKLLALLAKKGKFEGEKHQIDRYFTPAHRDFTSVQPVNEWLRLRDSSGKYSINFKYWHRDADGKGNFCDEYESVIESLEQVENIFKSLDVRNLVTVDKVRRSWLMNDFEVSIDSVKGLGDYVEVEYKGTDSKRDPEEITQAMVKFLKDAGCGKLVRDYRGYPYKLLFPGQEIEDEY